MRWEAGSTVCKRGWCRMSEEQVRIRIDADDSGAQEVIKRAKQQLEEVSDYSVEVEQSTVESQDEFYLRMDEVAKFLDSLEKDVQARTEEQKNLVTITIDEVEKEYEVSRHQLERIREIGFATHADIIRILDNLHKNINFVRGESEQVASAVDRETTIALSKIRSVVRYSSYAMFGITNLMFKIVDMYTEGMPDQIKFMVRMAQSTVQQGLALAAIHSAGGNVVGAAFITGITMAWQAKLEQERMIAERDMKQNLSNMQNMANDISNVARQLTALGMRM